MKFIAAVLREQNQDLSIEEIELRHPLAPGQLLVKVIYAGLCGRQLDEISGAADTSKYLPHLIGHEGIGSIVETWDRRKSKFTVGDIVIMHWKKASGLNSSPPLYFDSRNRVVNGGWVNTLTEFAVVSENRLTVWKEAPQAWHALLGCAIPTGLGVVLKESSDTSTASACLVVGTGGVGCFILEGLRARGNKHIYFVDKAHSASRRARDLGYTELPTELANFRSLFTRVYLTAVTQKTLTLAGTLGTSDCEIYLVGNEQFDAEVYLNDKFRGNHFLIKRSSGGSFDPDSDVPRYAEFIKTHGIVPKKQVIGTWRLTHLNQAIFTAKAHPGGRHVIQFDSCPP